MDIPKYDMTLRAHVYSGAAHQKLVEIPLKQKLTNFGFFLVYKLTNLAELVTLSQIYSRAWLASYNGIKIKGRLIVLTKAQLIKLLKVMT
ncbi:hypothetical protein BpHYR1_049081 [Brachionus plicatilis]|uniref:Uncharacterized protein n=1 Tax=Brachionus plicatilis TaxID=10195 RepID=A0A3M7Q268_BRAPC|nr:hypothetical protein BpHYR1_049081 [Brachionus plicatilis]